MSTVFGASGRFDQHYRRWLLGRLDHPLSTVTLDVGDRGRPLWSFLDAAEPRRLTVLGESGSGKTTLLQQTAQRLAQRSRLPRRRPVPVLLDLPTHADRILGEPEVPLVEVIADATAALPETAPAGWWAAALGDGRVVLLLDGLDRVVRPDDRAAVARWIGAREGNHLVVTAHEDVVPGSEPVRLRPPTAAQVRAVLRHHLPEGGDRLANHLAASADLHELMADPTLLALAATVYHGRGTFPRSRSALYADVLETPRQDALEALAFDLMSRRTFDTTADPHLSTVDGVLVGRDGRYRFAHRSFQEYLAARYIHRHGRESVLVDGLGDGWWRGVTLWWATMATADPVVEAGLGSADPAVLSLVYRCADDAAGIGDALAERMRALLVSGRRDPARRRLVAAVEADRLLRAFVVTPTGARVCRHPVSTDLYRLFRDDAEPAVPEPDGPGDPVHGPVRGVWDADAARFVRWVDDVTTEGTFRLPTADEVEPPARYTVTARDLVDAVAADVEPMLGHLLSLGIRARSIALERLLGLAAGRARRVLAGYHGRFRKRLAARLALAETRLNDLHRMSPKELGLGIMQVNAERRELADAIRALRERLDGLDDEGARRDEPNWEWAQRADAAVDRCLTRATGLFPDLGTGVAIRDVHAALRVDRPLNDLYARSASLHDHLDPDAMVSAGSHHDVQRARRALRQTIDDTQQISAVLDTVTSARPPTVEVVEPLVRTLDWDGAPDPSDAARSAAVVLRRPLGPAFATGMRHLLARTPETSDPVALCRAFARGLVAGAGLADGGQITVRLAECADEVARMQVQPGRNRLRQRLLREAGPVFARTGRGDAATIRLYALILAAGQSPDAMRHLAAATVTLTRPATETLVLVRD